MSLCKRVFLVPFLLLIVSAFSFYVTNHQELNVSLIYFAVYVFLAGIPFSLIFFSLFALSKRFRILHFYDLIVLIIGIMIWLQSQVFVWDLGPLDGRGIKWNIWFYEGVFEIVAVLFVSFVLIFFVHWKKNSSFKVYNFVYLLGFLSIFLNLISSTGLKFSMDKKNDSDSVLMFHPKRNTVVLLFDTFNTKYFNEIIKDKEWRRLFNGFTYYRNTISRFPTTRPSIPSILSGKIYNNQVPFENYVSNVLRGKTIKKFYKNKGYFANDISTHLPDEVDRRDVINSFESFNYNLLLKIIDFALFRSSPLIAKKQIYSEGDWFLSHYLDSKKLTGQFGSDLKIVNLIEKKSFVSDKYSGVYKFIWFWIPHNPIRVNENLQLDKQLKGKSGFIQQCKGALLLIKKLFQRFKYMGIYNDMEIVVLSDHGTIVPIFDEFAGDQNYIVPPVVQSSSLALMLHKKSKSKDKDLVISDIPLMLSDLPYILSTDIKNRDYLGYLNALNNQDRIRTFFYYRWHNKNWKDPFLPVLKEYTVDGHSFFLSNWQYSGLSYLKNKIVNTLVLTNLEEITIDENIIKSEIFGSGWSLQEKNLRWTDKQEAHLIFYLKILPRKYLKINMNLLPYWANGKIKEQGARFYISNKFITNIDFSKINEDVCLYVPKVLFAKKINLKIEIKNPGSGKEYHLSSDTRKLGIALKKIKVHYE